jgi:hypothetical protein
MTFRQKAESKIDDFSFAIEQSQPTIDAIYNQVGKRFLDKILLDDEMRHRRLICEAQET